MSRKIADSTRFLQRASGIDVRSNMLALLVINTLVMTGKGGIFQLACAAVVSGLLLLQRRFRASAILVLCIGTLSLLAHVATLTELPSGGLLLLAALMYLRPYLVAGFMGYYFICATPPGLLIAGLNRLRVPRAVTVSLAVMLRFFPVVWEEQLAIREALRMRGLPGKGGALLHPWKTLEYILIPLIGATIRSGDALTASALSRGLGNSAKPSSILSLKFGRADLLLMLCCTGLVTIYFFHGGV
ncbi:energy-coupling factor transporter transmembrane protein EcfT [Enterobacter hormaechei]|nr:energy-coupling factor transporter transmembrane protein EcfT [Enterobacter hormaechei]